jgi:hypothetical protein
MPSMEMTFHLIQRTAHPNQSSMEMTFPLIQRTIPNQSLTFLIIQRMIPNQSPMGITFHLIQRTNQNQPLMEMMSLLIRRIRNPDQSSILQQLRMGARVKQRTSFMRYLPILACLTNRLWLQLFSGSGPSSAN